MTRLVFAVSLLLLAAATTLAQRCGDSLLLTLRDGVGRALAPTDFDSAKVSAAYTVDNVADLRDAVPKLFDLAGGVKAFSVRAECGMKQAQFRLAYKGKVMIIRVLNVPGDAEHILLDSIVFREGSFEVDIGGRPLKNVERIEGASVGEDPANAVRWLIKDRSLRRIR